MKASEKFFGIEYSIIARVVFPTCVAGLATLSLVGPASAADLSAQDGGTRTVHERLGFRDLDLSTRQGAHTLLRRVEFAAANLCAHSGPQLTAGPTAEERQCRDQATARAIARLGSGLVNAAYAEETGRPRSLDASAVVATRP